MYKKGQKVKILHPSFLRQGLIRAVIHAVYEAEKCVGIRIEGYLYRSTTDHHTLEMTHIEAIKKKQRNLPSWW